MPRDHRAKLDRLAGCADPDCGGVAEPEQENDLHYWNCLACGYTFGYVQAARTTYGVDPDGTCSVGIPEDIRRAASAPARAALDAQLGPILTIGTRDGD